MQIGPNTSHATIGMPGPTTECEAVQGVEDSKSALGTRLIKPKGGEGWPNGRITLPMFEQAHCTNRRSEERDTIEQKKPAKNESDE